MKIDIERLRVAPSDWDALIRRYEGKTLFHESCWLAHVASIDRRWRIEYLQIVVDGHGVGYMPVVMTRKAVFGLSGSPMPGTGTNYMGPLVETGAPLQEVVAAVLTHLRRRGVAHVELAHRALEVLDHDRLGIDPNPDVTHVIPLTDTVERAFAQLKSTCRNRIRKAERSGLRVELTDDPSIVDHFIEQYAEVYGKQGLALPWGAERPQSLFNHLLPAGRVWPLQVWHGETVVAAGLFPFDEHAVYFWGAASWLRFQDLCPNELLHWHVIKMAVEHGIREYNMCGGRSQFKDKFGGSDIPYLRMSRSFLPGLRAARRLYSAAHQFRLRLRGALEAARRRDDDVKIDADAAS